MNFINLSNVLQSPTDRRHEKFLVELAPRATRYTAGMKIARLWVLVCLAGMVVGCGQKGPLVLPDTPKHKKVVPAPRVPASGTHSPAGTPATDAPSSPTESPSDTPSKP
jgi:predicted small lipoprotein YifL